MIFLLNQVHDWDRLKVSNAVYSSLGHLHSKACLTMQLVQEKIFLGQSQLCQCIMILSLKHNPCTVFTAKGLLI